MPQGERLHRRLTVLSAVLVLAGGMAACTSGGGAEPAPTAGTTGTPTAPSSEDPTAERPEVEKPVPPETMARDDVAGAEAAAQYFLELYPYVHATGDLTEWDEMSAPDCQFCQSVRDGVLQMHNVGDFQVGEGFQISFIDSRPPDGELSNFAVWIDATESPSTRYDAEGNALETIDGGALEFDISVHRADGKWFIEGVDHRDQATGA